MRIAARIELSKMVKHGIHLLDHGGIMSSIRIIGGVAIGITLFGIPLSPQWPKDTANIVGMMSSPASAAELAVPETNTGRKVQRRRSLRISRLYDLYCGGPYVGSGYNGGTYQGGPWIDLRCFEESIVRPLQSSGIPY
jgi:hypothetical protein